VTDPFCAQAKGGTLMISLQTAIIRLTFALVLGGLVGLERERGERAAGIRTHALVALGSCLLMIVSAFGFADILGTRSVVLDPSRIAAQVVSGIGFLGAGTILLRKEMVKGLTTAAAIWVVAAVGLACGSGLLAEAVVVTILTMVVLIALRPVRTFLHRRSVAYLIHVEADASDTPLLFLIQEICRQANVTIEQVQVQAGRKSEKLEIECRASDMTRLTRLVQDIRALPEVQTVQLTLRRADLARLSRPPMLGSSNQSGASERMEKEPASVSSTREKEAL
jgi:putative Mg2+ transporter-C (MgtC) family protein